MRTAKTDSETKRQSGEEKRAHGKPRAVFFSHPQISGSRMSDRRSADAKYQRMTIRRHSQAVRQRSAKPSSPVRFRVAPPRKGHLRVSFLRWRRHSFIGSAPCRHAARNPVRICRSEIDKLACQAESVQIFAFGEIPGDAPSLHRAGSVPPCGTESGSHLPLGDRQARLSGEERADIRFQRNSG